MIRKCAALAAAQRARRGDAGTSALKGWLAIAAQPGIVARSLHVALVVGTVLTLINQGDRLLALDIDAPTLARVALTYVVPYCVSTWAAVGALRDGRTR